MNAKILIFFCFYYFSNSVLDLDFKFFFCLLPLKHSKDASLLYFRLFLNASCAQYWSCWMVCIQEGVVVSLVGHCITRLLFLFCTLEWTQHSFTFLLYCWRISLVFILYSISHFSLCMWVMGYMTDHVCTG